MPIGLPCSANNSFAMDLVVEKRSLKANNLRRRSSRSVVLRRRPVPLALCVRPSRSHA
ncbi:unnamed protein product [Acanthoscelides obtectus]|uniref:Uncharacterized protein n=1 Tax=Acanthoscelides obtectus TaxID=200917 RepID=A0A9P0K3Z2_ACAOB|nr:unnamed protein product [Acanthoscelides obtectus]CAK1652312.1 hypothetical protein AOBTE_LOCUS17779 [Acanthoscelides obtectus]